MANWISVEDGLPEVAEDILAINNETWEIEYGFLSQVDLDNELDVHEGNWCDFTFRVTHWRYADKNLLPPEAK